MLSFIDLLENRPSNEMIQPQISSYGHVRRIIRTGATGTHEGRLADAHVACQVIPYRFGQ